MTKHLTQYSSFALLIDHVTIYACHSQYYTYVPSEGQLFFFSGVDSYTWDDCTLTLVSFLIMKVFKCYPPL